MEEWKDVKGHGDLFMVSNLGNIYSKRTKRALKLTRLKSGYISFATRLGGRKGITKCFRVHMLVANAFLGPPTEVQLNWAKNSHYGLVYVNHIDGDKSNNNANNLAWVTGKENSNHYAADLGGRHEMRKRRQTQAVLSDGEVIFARAQYDAGLSQRAIAKILSVSRDSVGRAIRGYKWVI